MILCSCMLMLVADLALPAGHQLAATLCQNCLDSTSGIMDCHCMQMAYQEAPWLHTSHLQRVL